MEQDASTMDREPMRLLQQPLDPKQLKRPRPSLRERFRRLSLLKKQAQQLHHPQPLYYPAPMPPHFMSSAPAIDDNSPRIMPAHFQAPPCTCCCHQYQHQQHLTSFPLSLHTNFPMVLVPAVHFYTPIQLHTLPPLHQQLPYTPYSSSSACQSQSQQTLSCPTTPYDSHVTLPCPYTHYVKEEKHLIDRAPRHDFYEESFYEENLDDDYSSDDDNATLRSATSSYM